jgi:hypothetical protein
MLLRCFFLWIRLRISFSDFLPSKTNPLLSNIQAAVEMITEVTQRTKCKGFLFLFYYSPVFLTQLNEYPMSEQFTDCQGTAINYF